MCNQTGNPAYDGYGVINKALWGHKGFRAENTEEKLLFLYLIAGPETQPSGLFPVSTDSMRDAISQRGHMIDIITSLEDSGLISYNGSDVWVRGMYEGIKDNGIRMAADEQVRMLPATPLRDEFMKHNKIQTSMGTTMHPGMVEAIASVTAVDVLQFSVDDVRRANNLGLINYTPEDILRLYSKPDSVWYTSDWRGMKSPPQMPTLRNIEQTIGPLSTVDESPRRMSKDEAVRMVENVQEAGSSSKVARAHIDRTYPDLWEAMRKVMPWRDWLYFQGDIKFKVYEAIGNLND